MTAYPHTPGFKTTAVETSRNAAKSVTSKASKLRVACLDILKRETHTADELAEMLDETVLYVRPRVSELLALGSIVATGQRRKNISGKPAAVWRAS